MHQVLDLLCPGCGGPISIEETNCKYCSRPIIVSTFNNVYSMPTREAEASAANYRAMLGHDPNNAAVRLSIAMCYLRLNLHDSAVKAFADAIECNLNNSEAYFYAAVALLKGNKPFLHSRDEIQKIMEYVNAAIAIEARGIYYYFLAYVKKDYFERKYLNSYPKSHELLALAKQRGYSRYDVQQLDDILGNITGL